MDIGRAVRPVTRPGALGLAEGAITDGRIRALGFSFDDDYPVLHEITDAYDRWTFCQIHYDYTDIENQASTEWLAYAASRGLAVVIVHAGC